MLQLSGWSGTPWLSVRWFYRVLRMIGSVLLTGKEVYETGATLFIGKEAIMAKYIKWTVISLALAVFFWVMLLVVNPSNFELLVTIGAMVCSVCFICFLVICINQKMKKPASPYRVFAITDGVLAVCVALYAVYDILTDTGWFAGLFGLLLLIFVLPLLLVLLLADFLVWRSREKGKHGWKRSKKKT